MVHRRQFIQVLRYHYEDTHRRVRLLELRKGNSHTLDYCMVNCLHRLCKTLIQLDHICFTGFKRILNVFVKPRAEEE